MMHTIQSGRNRPTALLPVVAMLLMLPVHGFSQAGTPPRDKPPPAQQPQPSDSGKSSDGGVSTGVSVDVGNVLRQVFKKRYRVTLQAAPAAVYAGQPVTLNAGVSPAKPELSYVFQWSKDAPGEQKDTPTAAHTFNSPGQYKVRVTVYEKGKKLASSDELTITVLPAAGTTVAAGNPAPPVEIKLAPPVNEAKAGPPAGAPSTATAPASANAVQSSPAAAPATEQTTKTPALQQASIPELSAAPENKNKKGSVAVAAAPAKKAGSPPGAGVLGATVTAPPEYSASFHVVRGGEAGRPVIVEAQITSRLPSGKNLKYCFEWGDGERTCVHSSSASHVYRKARAYEASVEIFAGQERLAAAGPLRIIVVTAPWVGIWPGAAILLLLIIAGYSLHKLRKMARLAVTARIPAGRYTVNAQTSLVGESLQIRCVPSSIRSTVTFSSVDGSIHDKEEAAHV